MSFVLLFSNVGVIGINVDKNVFASNNNFEDSLVLSLPFENDVKDISKNGFVTSVNKESVFVEGVVGKAIKLDGTNYIDLGKSDKLQPENLTVSMWIKAEANLTGENMITWFKPNGNYQGKGWYLSSINDTEPLKISIGESSAQPMEAFVSGSRSEFFPVGKWVHIAVTVDAETKNVSMYRNGVALEVKYLNAKTNISSDNTSNKYIGFNSPSYNGGFAKFLLDEFKIYNSKATANDIIDIYTKAGGVFDSSKVIDSDYESLKINLSEVKNDIILPVEGIAGSKITWKSSNESVISNEGKVNRPKIGEDDVVVKLTATLTFNETKKEKEFEVKVISLTDFKTLNDFSLEEVEITDEYYINSQEKMIEYLKELQADKLVAGFLTNKGLEPKDSVYGGWESTAIKGHTLGHYLTAISQGYANTKDNELKEKIDYIVKELSRAQFDSGYLAAIPENHYKQLDTGNSSGTWVPWYTMHKVIAGLTDTYRLTGNKEALEVVSKLADWVYEHTSKWNDQTQNTVLAIEYGGMNECLYDLYRITKSDKHKKAAAKFDEETLFLPLYNGIDELNGKHANTTIPKIIGALNKYRSLEEQDEYYLQVAENFWEIVVNNHSYVTGGNSEWEHFGLPNILDAERTNANCETCNTYNMLKLSRELFKITGDIKYADFYENTYINAIMSSQNPQTGMTTYFQPMASGYFKVYSSKTEHFWCCTGTGLENFTKLNDSIYFKGDKSIYVNQFVSSTLTSKDNNIKITQKSSIFEDSKTKFTVNTLDEKENNTRIYIRVPEWTSVTPKVKVNGEEIEVRIVKGYIVLDRAWKNNDIIELEVGLNITVHKLQDNENIVAFKYGPLVLSANLGSDNLTTGTTGVNVTIPNALPGFTDLVRVKGVEKEEYLANINSYIVKTEGKLEFTMKNTDKEYLLTPHYMQHTQRYAIYMNIQNDNSDNEVKDNIYERKFANREESVIIDSVPVSNDQYELAHNMKGENTTSGSHKGFNYRDASANGWFSYEMKVDDKYKNNLAVKYFSGDAGRTFKILVDDKLLEEVVIENINPDDFYDVSYELKEELIKGKESVVIKFETQGDSFAGGVFDKVSIKRDYDTEAFIEDIKVSNGKLEEKIDSKTNKITIYVDEKSKDTKLDFLLCNENALLYIDDVLVDETKSFKISLDKEETNIKVLVKAEDFETTKEYNISIIKGDKQVSTIIIIVIILIGCIVTTLVVILIKNNIKKNKKGIN